MAEEALAAVIQEAYIQGISTRSVVELVNAMGMSDISKGQVSRLREEMVERVQAFLGWGKRHFASGLYRSPDRENLAGQPGAPAGPGSGQCRQPAPDPSEGERTTT